MLIVDGVSRLEVRGEAIVGSIVEVKTRSSGHIRSLVMLWSTSEKPFRSIGWFPRLADHLRIKTDSVSFGLVFIY